MTTGFNALVLGFDLLFTPFLVGAATLAMMGWLRRKPKRLKPAWMMVFLAGVACALVHALGVLLLWWRDGDWLGYLAICLTAAIAAMLVHK
jgi:hypothetical protein